MDLDLAIVGAGPAGVSTALFLAAAAPRLRDRIAILEKERFPRDKICAGAVGRRADRLLAQVGVRVDVPSAAVRGFDVVCSRGRRIALSDAPIGRVVRRLAFDHALVEAARARGVRVLEGARVTGLHVERGGVRLDTSLGEVRARAVVGADGIGSVVRRAIGAPRGAWRAQAVEVDTPAVAVDPGRELLHFDLTDPTLAGYAWDFPTLVEGRPMVCRGLYELRPDPAVLDVAPPGRDLEERLRERLARLGLDGPFRVKRFAERGLSLHEPLARPHVLLVGEAAGIDPALGEGIAQGVFYGAAAGPYLARCLDRDELSFVDYKAEIRASRVGLDLRVRAAFTPLLYGRARAVAERWVATSADLGAVGARYFAGERVPRRRIAGAALALARAAAGEITSWWAPSS